MMIPCNYYINVAKRSARYPLGEHYATIELGDCQRKVAEEKFEELSKMFNLNLFILSLYYVECYGKPLADTNKNDNPYAIDSVEPTYTGGGTWIFYGKLRNGNYFVVDDYGWTVVLDADPREDEEQLEEWFNEHAIQELTGQEGVDFRTAMLDIVEADKENCMLEDYEMERYRKEFRKEGN